MAEVMAPPSEPTSQPFSLSPEPQDADGFKSQPDPPQQSQDHIPSYADSRMSSSTQHTSHSRAPSTAYLPGHSSLAYALVRDFAYPTFHPMHFGAPPDDPSGASTPASDWNSGRRQSESAEGSAASGRSAWSAGPWGGDGALYGDPEQHMQPLPSTSFGNVEDWAEDDTSFRKSKHRKSRSFADIPNYERGRRRESQNRTSGAQDSGLFVGSGTGSHNHDPAGRDALRQSRGFAENGDALRRDSHFATTLPSRSFHTSQTVDPDEEMPLDAEPSTHSPQRESIGPEDEELFAGPSLALYSFEPENDNELRLTEGQTIMVSYRHGQGWLVAENPQTGEQGLVPEQYVRLLRDIEGWDEERGGFIDDDELTDGHGVDMRHIPDTTTTGDDMDYDVEMKKMQIDDKH